MEIGVHDGENDNNTFKLDTDYGWNGVCVDPYMDNMRRRTCQQYNVALGNTNADSVGFLKLGGLSSLAEVGSCASHNVHHELLSRNGTKSTVDMRTPKWLLKDARVPPVIDYMSVDVEGAELLILNEFPFDEYCVRAMSVETNDQHQVERDLHELLSKQGYTYEGHSGVDEFYVKDCGGS